MRRIAFFVEGYTEMLFVAKLISEIADAKKVVIEQKQIRGGSKSPRSVTTVKASKNLGDELFYILIYDCGGDRLVKQRILEEHPGLTKLNYEKIIGIRDIRPDFSREEIGMLRRGLRTYIKTSLAPVVFIIPIMELEAWLLAETNHYANINKDLTVELIESSLGFNPQTDDMSLREKPAEDLDQVYGLVQKSYSKGDLEVIESLDFAHIYYELKEKIPELKDLIEHIDSFLTTDNEIRPEQ